MSESQVNPDDLSVEQIEDNPWGEPPPGSTRLVESVHRLRRRPVRDLEPEDLRVLISQQVGLDPLVPRVLTQLEVDPLLEGDFYPGDVLVAVLKVPAAYWSAHPDQRTRLERVIASVDEPDLKADIETFHAANPM
ncbi:contact-dependent growth inhibition system immunity protein [Kibdelosporangium lantanae]|uniref:Contact-dependent growth inhibition system immunity protein n=1 Tax=Kibdelosporangium lantanae TaxID=1497396 RepID=A0ABW3M6X6_9PSEU